MRTGHRMLVLAAVAFLPLASFCHSKNGMDESVVHGTVNIALANKNGLVVVTDSMLTAGDGKQLDQPGQKLFKLDDQTVCAIAGFVSAGGPTPELSANTSALIQEYVRQSRGQPRQSISEKLRA